MADFTISFIKTTKEARAPIKKTLEAACFDLSSVTSSTLHPRTPSQIPLGIKLNIPSGLCGRISIRSSLGKQGLSLINGVGVIDSDFHDELYVTLINLSPQPIYIQKGERIVQIFFEKVLPIKILQTVDDVTEEYIPPPSTRHGGFGSTGKF